MQKIFQVLLQNNIDEIKIIKIIFVPGVPKVQ